MKQETVFNVSWTALPAKCWAFISSTHKLHQKLATIIVRRIYWLDPFIRHLHYSNYEMFVDVSID